jgi:predicted transcriptional regulator
MGALVGRVPCFTLELGSDLGLIPEAVVELLEALR